MKTEHILAMAGAFNTAFLIFNLYFARRNGRVLRTSHRLMGGFTPKGDIFDAAGASIGSVLASGLRNSVGGIVPTPKSSGGKKISI